MNLRASVLVLTLSAACAPLADEEAAWTAREAEGRPSPEEVGSRQTRLDLRDPEARAFVRGRLAYAALEVGFETGEVEGLLEVAASQVGASAPRGVTIRSCAVRAPSAPVGPLVFEDSSVFDADGTLVDWTYGGRASDALLAPGGVIDHLRVYGGERPVVLYSVHAAPPMSDHERDITASFATNPPLPEPPKQLHGGVGRVVYKIGPPDALSGPGLLPEEEEELGLLLVEKRGFNVGSELWAWTEDPFPAEFSLDPLFSWSEQASEETFEDALAAADLSELWVEGGWQVPSEATTYDCPWARLDAPPTTGTLLPATAAGGWYSVEDEEGAQLARLWQDDARQAWVRGADNDRATIDADQRLLFIAE